MAGKGKFDNSKQDPKTRIIRYLTKSDIGLLAAETAILTRWEFADQLMRQGETNTEDLITQIITKFSVSRHTADSDITTAMEVFAKSRKINRKYFGHLHLQDIAKDLKLIRAAMFKVDGKGNQVVPDSKEIQALSKLHDAYTYQLNSLPDDLEQQPIVPIVMQFSLPATQQLPPALNFQDALLMADKMIEDIAHEDITHDTTQE